MTSPTASALRPHWLVALKGHRHLRRPEAVGEALSALIRQVLEGQQEVLEEIRSGKDKKGAKLKFLQGLVMRAARGQADPQEVGTLLQDLVRGA